MKLLIAILLWVLMPVYSYAQIGNLFVGQNAPGKYAAQTNLLRCSAGSTVVCLNALKGSTSYIFGAGDTPAILDNDGYPSGVITTSIAFNVFFADANTGPSTQWVFKYPATRTMTKLHINNSLSVVSATGCTVTSAGSPKEINGIAGQACRVVFTFGSLPSNLGFIFEPGSYSGSGEMFLGRVSDEAAYDAGGPNSYYIPEYIAVLRATQAKMYRTADETHNGGLNTNLTRWNYRNKLTNFSWVAQTYPTGAWGGTISGDDNTYAVNPPPDAGGTLNDGDTIQGVFTNASHPITVSGAVSNGGNVQLTVSSSATLSPSQQVWVVFVGGTTEANGFPTILTVDDGTHITLNVPFVHAYTSGGSVGTAKLTVTGTSYPVSFISDMTSEQPPTSAIAAGTIATLVYNKLNSLWLYRAGGILPFTPIEAMVARSNLSNNSGLWLNWPDMADDDFVTRIVDYTRSNLVGDFWHELSNEVWNPANNQTFLFDARGIAMGWSNANGQSYLGWLGFRTRQIMGIANTEWTAARNISNIHGILATQAVASTSNTQTQLLNGTQMNEDTFPLYCAYVGGVYSGTCSVHLGYNSAPNRPVDLMRTWSTAPYSAGANVADNGINLYSASNIGQGTFLQNLVNLYETGVPADHATALALMDNDFKQGTNNTQSVTISGGDTFTIGGTNYSAGNRVVFTTTGTLFSGLSLSTVYFIVSPSGSTFKVSLTSGGSPVTGISGGTGTQSVGLLARGTAMGLASTEYIGWEAMAASYDSARAGFTPPMPPIDIESYEGGFSPIAPIAAQCTTLGVTTPSAAACAADIAQLILDYKNNTNPNYGVGIVLYQFRAFVGTQPGYPGFGALTHNKTPDHFLLTDGGQYSLYPTGIFSTPFQTYYGFQQFPYLFNRDLNPASNDNTPAFLAKVG